MSWKAGAKYSLLAFVAASVAAILWQEVRHGAPPAEAAAAPAPASRALEGAAPPARPGENRVLVYYFYTSVRCPTCRQIEARSEEIVRTVFGDALRDGRIEWLPSNVQLPQNRHFIRDYELFTKSLVIVLVKEGRQVQWKNLEKVWELVADRKAFARYVQGEIEAYLRKL